MGRREDLESHIRQSYRLVREYEDILRLSNRPEEKARSRRAIEGQWNLIRSYLAEYQALVDRLGLEPSDDIVQIATHFGNTALESDVPTLRKVLVDKLSEQELRLLCLDLGLDFAELSGVTLSSKITELLDFLRRRDRLDEIDAYVRREYPQAT
jgi:hypothetical protein